MKMLKTNNEEQRTFYMYSRNLPILKAGKYFLVLLTTSKKELSSSSVKHYTLTTLLKLKNFWDSPHFVFDRSCFLTLAKLKSNGFKFGLLDLSIICRHKTRNIAFKPLLHGFCIVCWKICRREYGLIAFTGEYPLNVVTTLNPSNIIFCVFV